MRIYPVILCGGSGTRLWPTSREGRPKQFLPLLGERSLFQNTVLRMTDIAGGQEPLVVAGEAHVGFIERQLAELGLGATIMIEPEGRDSAPAVAAAAAWVAEQDPFGVAAMVASDHHIPDAAAFRRAVEAASPAASNGAIVTFGVRPTEPSTAYGYLSAGAPLAETPAVLAVDRFVEKPDAATARAYVEAGYLWNTGNFVFGADTLAQEMALHAPQLWPVVVKALQTASRTGRLLRLGEAFRAAPRISIDYAVMEKTRRAAVLPVDFAWSDVGAWDAVWGASSRNAEGNAVQGDVLLVDSRDSLVRVRGGPMVIGVGLKQIGVIAEADAILVCDLSSSQKVKEAVDGLKALRRHEISAPAAPGGTAGLDDLRERFSRWLFASALPLWWSLGADHELGGFREVLDADARPVRAPLRARVQARQAFVFALAGSMGWPGPWRQAVEQGLGFLDARYRRADGLYSTLLTPDGAPSDETAMVYDQAFVMLALAQAAKAIPGTDYVVRARATLEGLKAAYAHEAGGFREPAGMPYQADPQMHLLEAALAWTEAGGGEAWDALADCQAELGLARLIDAATGAVKENFAADWSPAPGADGRLIEPGHQFEWAWLLERWGRLRGRRDARTAARRLFAAGERGVDPGAGVAVNDLYDDFTIADPGARLWPQTERLKAAAILAEDEADPVTRAGYLAAAVQAGEALMRYFEGPVPGLWRDKRRPDGSFVDEPSPASSFYHIACAIAELRTRL